MDGGFEVAVAGVVGVFACCCRCGGGVFAGGSLSGIGSCSWWELYPCWVVTFLGNGGSLFGGLITGVVVSIFSVVVVGWSWVLGAGSGSSWIGGSSAMCASLPRAVAASVGSVGQLVMSACAGSWCPAVAAEVGSDGHAVVSAGAES